jgi:DNA-binding GntR family transcriptional regulator
MQLSPSAGHPYQAIAAQIAREIDAGQREPEQQLPSVRELAKRYDVTVATAQRAVTQLAADGYISVVPGLGSFVRERGAAADEPSEPGLAEQFQELRDEVAALRSRVEAIETVQRHDA